MKSYTTWGLILVAAAAAFAVLLPAVATAQPPWPVEVSALPQELTFDAGAAYDGLRLTLGGPGGVTFELRAEAADTVVLGLEDAQGEPLPDGLYAYELQGKLEDWEVPLRSGFFSIEGGAFVSPDLEERPEDGRGIAAKGPAPFATKDTVIVDDTIIIGSLCVGFDCVNNEVFGNSTILLKENNLRIEFEDTSSMPSFPSTDWQIRANDLVNGGANLFAVDDLTQGTTPFTIVGGAPNNALFVNAQGKVGVGTPVPQRQLHLRNGHSPGLRLEQDGSAGFTPQIWEVTGDEIRFFVQDVTHGNSRPFSIVPGAPTSSLYIQSTGDVGLGTQTPSARLDVLGDIAVSGVVDGRDVAADGTTLDAHVIDFDNPHQVTAAQTGADPAGTAASTVAAHEAAFDHGNIPSALPVPVTEGGTGATDAATARGNLGIEEDATKAGIQPAAGFDATGTATVTFATPYPAGTSYVVVLTAVTTDAQMLSTPNVLAKGETGFTVTVGSNAQGLAEVDWLARPVGE